MVRSHLLAILLLLPFTVLGQKNKGKTEQLVVIDKSCVIPLPKKLVPPGKDASTACIIPQIKGKPAPPKYVPLTNPYHYPNPRLSVKIALTHTVIHHIRDLRFKLTLTNNTQIDETFLFDRIDVERPFLFGTTCRVLNSKEQTVLKYANRPAMDSAMYNEHRERYYYKLESTEWLLKEYSVDNLAVFEDAIEKSGKLPPGRYTLQIDFQNNFSNTVSFEAE